MSPRSSFQQRHASKWDVWTHVIAVPQTLDGVDALDYFRARQRWGSRRLMRFLIGTAANLLIAIIAAGIGHLVERWLSR